MYKPGDFLELPNGRSVRLNKDTAEIANAVRAKINEMAEAMTHRSEVFPEGLYHMPSGRIAKNANSFLDALETLTLD